MSSTWTWLALGDSITAGVGAPPGKGYADRISVLLARRRPSARTIRICRSGWRCGDLTRVLDASFQAAVAIREADLATIYIGGNNLLFAWFKYLLIPKEWILEEALDRFAACFNGLLRRMTDECPGALFTFNLYNPFPAEPLARRYIPRLNDVIAMCSSAWAVPVINVHDAFSGRESSLIAGYRSGRFHDLFPDPRRFPIHPNSRGHRLIAETFWKRFAG